MAVPGSVNPPPEIVFDVALDACVWSDWCVCFDPVCSVNVCLLVFLGLGVAARFRAAEL